MYQDSPLFKSSFGSSLSGGPGARLVQQLAKTRERVAALLEKIPSDCKGLTIHDVTHLDALWDIASTIIGDAACMNPSEAFVFGTAVLLHDAGLTAAAYPQGISGLRATTAWRDNEAVLDRRLRLEGLSLSEDEKSQQLLFATLRQLHASQAEKLPTERWSSPLDGSDVYLIEDVELRNAYGRSIGKIAGSHHWDLPRVTDLRPTVGPPPSLPNEWAVDERKLALFLRTADIAHIDQRRAPLMHYALQKPVGTSELHWRFQAKVLKPTRAQGLLTYASGSAFDASEADAWWLAYETVAQIDKEITASNRILASLSIAEMAAGGVFGAGNVEAFARYVPVEGWTPVDATVKVSDPKHLAAVLGGRNLYGAGLRAPIRELLQNAVDAIRARRSMQGQSSSHGTISLEIFRDASGLLLKISDDGIGMSEAVMTGPLIDFGKSIWGSDMLSSEYPGLASGRPEIIGKYGIGFFSVFDIAESVSVISRKYGSALDEVNRLHFGNLLSRPILSKVDRSALPSEASTTIKLKIKESSQILNEIGRLRQTIEEMIPSLDVRVEVTEESGTHWVHFSDVYKQDKKEVARWLLRETPSNEVTIAVYESLLQPIVSSDNKPLGLLAIDVQAYVDTQSVGRHHGRVVLSSQGFATDASFGYEYFDARMARFPENPRLGFAAAGILESDVTNVSRNAATIRASNDDLQRWLVQQAIVMQSLPFADYIKARIGFDVLCAGYDSSLMPVAYFEDRFITASELFDIVDRISTLCFPVSIDYSGSPSLVGPITFVAEYVGNKLDKNVVIIFSMERRELYGRDIAERVKLGLEEISEEVMFKAQGVGPLLALVAKRWACNLKFAIAQRPVLAEEAPFLKTEHQMLVVSKVEPDV